MNYFYHLLPEPFIGSKLIPLNEMNPEGELYKSHNRKYLGREELTEEIIPILNCKWNDVVQFSALNPQLIINELRKIQSDFQLFRTKCFKVSVVEVEELYEGVIFNRNINQKKGDFSISDEEVMALNSKNYTELKSVPPETMNYWNSVKRDGGKFLWFPYITHIFLKGAIDTTNFEVINLK
ncbi:hypothetical protein [Halobacteriovorax sp. JY17]|uniref:hypothetical protein n=1 Tax=Halobacteriovorax sp. JY17 TaxID=2014617 RepID=UPI000C53E248|nr:hypothetical protein [Halobacteriovorax sp. JY17]PIK14936.1 MAG: hypothetical protein CES88_11425 [Halobacteriovorax sp. JY17]